MPMDLSVVIPCYNEAASLPELLAQLERALASWQPRCEVIVVNDGSTDDSGRLLGELAAARPWLKVVNLRRNYGQTAAMMAGFEWATGDILVAMDADLQNDPADIPRLVAKLN